MCDLYVYDTFVDVYNIMIYIVIALYAYKLYGQLFCAPSGCLWEEHFVDLTVALSTEV